jgi:hypothetical protein
MAFGGREEVRYISSGSKEKHPMHSPLRTFLFLLLLALPLVGGQKFDY